MKVPGETNRLDILNSNRFKVGMTAFKKRMKRNLPLKEYKTQMV
jgi:hypothetical protein